MSGDFEIMPLGTIEEVKAMRKFAREIVDLANQLANQFGTKVPKPLLEKIDEMNAFYAKHTLKYPV